MLCRAVTGQLTKTELVNTKLGVPRAAQESLATGINCFPHFNVEGRTYTPRNLSTVIEKPFDEIVNDFRKDPLNSAVVQWLVWIAAVYEFTPKWFSFTGTLTLSELGVRGTGRTYEFQFGNDWVFDRYEDPQGLVYVQRSNPAVQFRIPAEDLPHRLQRPSPAHTAVAGADTWEVLRPAD